MTVLITDAPCEICLNNYSIMHSHHTIPRSRGGEDSKQIILCPTCHNLLHSWAYHLISKNPKGIKQFFVDSGQIDRAQPYLRILTESLLKPIPEGTKHPIQFRISDGDYQLFKMLCSDMNKSQIEVFQEAVKCLASKLGIIQIKSKNWWES